MEDKRKVIIMVVLLAVIPVLLWWQLRLTPEQQQAQQRYEQERPAPRTRQTPTQNTNEASAMEDLDLDSLLASVREVDFDYEVHRDRNPMRPLVGPTSRTGTRVADAEQELMQPALAMGSAASMNVTGIIWDVNRPIAVISNARGNDEIVYRGYRFSSGAVVEDIEATRVLLRVDDSLIPIELEEL